MMVMDPYRFPTEAGPFDPETDITWHSLFWAEGSDFLAQGYSDTDTVTTWPNETGESDGAADGAPVLDIDGVAGQPAVVYNGSNSHATSAFSVNPSYTSGVTVVVIGRQVGSDGGNRFLFDGIGASNRNAVFRSGGTGGVIYAGSSQNNASFTNDADFGLTAFYSTSGNEVLTVDGVETVNAAAGSQTLTGLTIGENYAGSNGGTWRVAFFGVYEGDITGDGSWADFQSWASSHYGVTI